MNTDTLSSAHARPRPVPRRFLRRATWVAIGLVALVLALPSLFSMTIGPGYLEGAIGERVNGKVRVSSLLLRWFSSQSVAMSVDGGDEVGKVDLFVEVEPSLFALATGSDVRIKLIGNAMSRTGIDGSPNILKLIKLSAPAEPAETPSSDVSSASARVAPFFGSRVIEVSLEKCALGTYDAARTTGSMFSVSGMATLAQSDARLDLQLSIGTKQGADSSAQGTVALKGDVHVEQRTNGAVDLHHSTMDLAIEVKDARVSTNDGEMKGVGLAVHATKDAEGSIAIDGSGSGAIDGHAPSTLSMKVRAPECIDAEGRTKFDPSSLVAHVDLRAFPVATLTPALRAFGMQAPLDPVLDFGESADIAVQSEGAGSLFVVFDTQRVKLRFEGRVAADGGSVQEGRLEGSVLVRSEVATWLTGCEVDTPLAVEYRGNAIEWTKPKNGVASTTNAVAGNFAAELKRPVAMIVPPDMLNTASPTRADFSICTLRAEKRAGDEALTTHLDAQWAIDGSSPTTLQAQCAVDLGTKAIAVASASLSAPLHPALVSAWTNGAVKVGPRGAHCKATVAGVKLQSGAQVPVEGGRVRLEVGGSLVLEGAGTQSAVTDLAIAIDFPQASREGSVALNASVDGASTRIAQSFVAIPKSIEEIAPSGLHGTIDLVGVDPRLLSRIAPSTTPYLGILGRDPLTVSVRNESKGGKLVAEYALRTVTAESSGAMLLSRDSLAFESVRARATLNAEGLASLPLGQDMFMEPGAEVSIALPSLSLTKTTSGFQLPNAIAATVALKNVRVLRASWLRAPIGLASLEAKLGYEVDAQRATCAGVGALGGGGTAGSMRFDLAWTKPTNASLFGGVSGEVVLNDFDIARFEPSFGFGAGEYSSALGGRGAVTARMSDGAQEQLSASLEFPSLQGSLTLRGSGDAKARTVQGSANLTATISKERFAKLAAIDADATRRVLQPVIVGCSLEPFVVPLNEALKPKIEEVSFRATGSLSPVSIEVLSGQGANATRAVLSTGALKLKSSCTRLGDQLTLRLESDASTASQGDVAIDAKAAQLLGASPSVDMEIRATKFPAATIDVLAGTGGAVQKYVGDAIDAEFVAKHLSRDRGVIAASLRGAQASLEAPEVALRDGFLRITKEHPLRVTCAVSGAVKQELLATINPVFTDVQTTNPVVFTVSSLDWPMDGDRRKFDALFDLTLGEVQFTNSGVLAFLLSSGGMDGIVEPLHASVVDGRLAYRDFFLRLGTMPNKQWKNTLAFTGDVDLVRLYANAITTEVPLSDATHWSSKADLLVQGLGASGQEFVRNLKVGVKLSGPLFDANGKPAKLEVTPTFPDVGKSILDNPGGLIDLGTSIFDALKK